MLRRAIWLVPLMFGLAVASLALLLRFLVRRSPAVAEQDAIVEIPAAFGEDPRVEIWRMNERYLLALREADAASFAAAFLDDALAMPGAGPIVRGRSAIEAAMGATLATFRFLEAEMSTVDLRLSGDTAIETGHYRYLVSGFAGESTRTLVGRYAIVWKRHDRAWRIAFDGAQPGVLDG
jgi:uncharacterized protein (TIGR02246 family)